MHQITHEEADLKYHNTNFFISHYTHGTHHLIQIYPYTNFDYMLICQKLVLIVAYLSATRDNDVLPNFRRIYNNAEIPAINLLGFNYIRFKFGDICHVIWSKSYQ